MLVLVPFWLMTRVSTGWFCARTTLWEWWAMGLWPQQIPSEGFVSHSERNGWIFTPWELLERSYKAK